MQNPSAAAYRTSSLGVRASRILLLMGVFAVVPAAGTLPTAHIASALDPAGTLTGSNAGVAVSNDDLWRSDFNDMMRRLWKWWPCAISNPDETPEQQMERMRDCMRDRGVPGSLVPADEDEIAHDIDDLLNHTNDAPESVNSKAVVEFQNALNIVLAKLG